MRSLHKNIINQAVIPEELLIKEGHFYTADGLSTLQLAAREGRANVVMHLLAANLDNNIDEFEEKQTEHHHPDAVKTPFYLAVEYGHTFLAIKLLAYGASRDLALRIATRLSHDHLIDRILDIPFQKHLTALRMLSLAEIIESKNDIAETEITAVASRFKTLITDADAISGIIELLLQRSARFAPFLLQQYTPRSDESILTAGYWAAVSRAKDISILEQACQNDDSWLLTLRQLHIERQNAALTFCLKHAPKDSVKQFTDRMHSEIPAPQNGKLTNEQIYLYQCASRSQVDDYLFDYEHLDYLIVMQYALQKYNYIAVKEIVKRTYLNLRNDFLNYLLEEDEFEIAQILFSEFNFSYTLTVPGEVFGIDQFPLFLQAFSSNEGYAHQLINAGIKQDELPSKELVSCARTLLPNPPLYVAILLRCITNRYHIPFLQLESDPLTQDSLKLNPLLPYKVYHVMTNTELSAHDFSLISIMLERFGVVLSGKKPPVLEAKKASYFDKLPADILLEIIPCLSGQSLAAIPAVSQRFHQYKLQALRQDKFGVKWQEEEKLWVDIRAHEKEFKQCLDKARLLMMLVESIEEDMRSSCCLQDKYSQYKGVLFAVLCAILPLAISILLLLFMIDRAEIIKDELKGTMTSDGKHCMDLNGDIHCVIECEALCREYINNNDFIGFSIFFLGMSVIFFSCLLSATANALVNDNCRRENPTTLRQASHDVNETLQELLQAFPQLLRNTSPTSRRIDLLREAQAAQAVNQTTRTNLNTTSMNFATQVTTKAKFYTPSTWQFVKTVSEKAVNNPVIININDPASKSEQKKRDKKIKDGRRTFGKAYVSPARLMDNIFSMFKSEPEVSFDQANSRLLCGDNSDSESDKDSSDETLELIRHKR